jgi:hypothetical protein
VLLAGSAAAGLLAACSTPPAPPAAATTAPAPAPATAKPAAAASAGPSAPAAASPSAAAASPSAAASPAAAAAASPAVVPSPSAAPAAASSGKTIRAAFVYTGPINDHGWSNAHDDGRKALEQALGSGVETNYTENVPETADSQRVFEDYARWGHTGRSCGLDLADAWRSVGLAVPGPSRRWCQFGSLWLLDWSTGIRCLRLPGAERRAPLAGGSGAGRWTGACQAIGPGG